MRDAVVTAANVRQFMDQLQEELQAEPVLLVTSKSARTGKWGMAKLWRLWMSTTAEFMAARGVTVDIRNSAGQIISSQEFTAEDAHELFSRKWLGVDEEGRRLSWSRSGREGMRPATKGERWWALRQHEDWATDKGIALFVPRESEYRDLSEEQTT